MPGNCTTIARNSGTSGPKGTLVFATINDSLLKPVEKLYCMALSQNVANNHVDFLDLYHSVGDEPLWNFANYEQTVSIVGDRLTSLMPQRNDGERWREAKELKEKQISLYLEQLDRVAHELDQQGIRLVALKNSGLARALKLSLAATPMGDVDVLVSPTDFLKAHDVMLRLGFTLGDRSPFDVTNIEEAVKHGGAEYTITLADGSTLWFELQWRPVAGRWIQPGQEPDPKELLDRSLSIDGSKARLLSPEDNLLQVCLHTAKHSYVRAPGFRLHTDVDRIVTHFSIDWDKFLVLVEALKVRTSVYLSLLIPFRLFNTPIPLEVLKRLNISPVKHRIMESWIAKVGLFGPHERKWSRLGYILFNLCLYDSLFGVWNAVFPKFSTMKTHYHAKSRWGLPLAYLRRIFALVLQRAKT